MTRPAGWQSGRVGGRILVIDLLGGLGDLLLALPMVHALAAAHPNARLTVLTHAPGHELLAADDAVDEVRVAAAGAEATTVARVLAESRPDLVVSTTRHGGIPALVEATGVRSVTDLWRRPPADQRVDERYLRILREEAVIGPGEIDGAVRLTDAEIEAGSVVVVEDRPVVLVPHAGMVVKQWPMARWRALAARLRAAGVAVLSCAEKPVELPGARALPVASLRGIAGMFAATARRGGVVVGGDTGPVRLAAAVGCAVVGLFGPTTAARYGLRGAVNLQGLPGCPFREPLAISESPCWWTAECPLRARGPACLADLGVAGVRDAALRALAP